MEIAYSLTGYRRIIKVYDWYEIQELGPFGVWKRVYRGYNLRAIVQRFEEWHIGAMLVKSRESATG